MISRTESKLKKVEADINKMCPDIKTKTMVANFQTEQSLAWYHNIFDQVKDLDISMVIVNAGEMYCGTLEDKGLKFKYQIDTNIYHFVMFHRFFIPYLLEKTAKIKDDKHLAIIGVCSASGVRPFPTGLLTYAGTKACTKNLFVGMQKEIRDLDGTKLPNGA